MRAFAAVVELGSFARASEQLDISTTAASRLVADLEKHLGAQLLQRSTRRLTLTETGATYFERCRQILADIDEAEATAGSFDVRPRGLLRINLPVSFGLRYVVYFSLTVIKGLAIILPTSFSPIITLCRATLQSS